MKTPEELRDEVRADLLKSEEELLTNVYEEILNNPNRLVGESAMHAAKRFSALLGKSIVENAKSTEQNLKLQSEIHTLNTRLLWLTIIILAFTFIGAVSSVVQACYARASYNLSLKQSQEQSSPKIQQTK